MGAQVPVTAVRAVTGPLAVVLLVILAGCGSASDTGATALVVREPGADEPEVDGASVILIPVVNVTGSGVREWEVRAVEPGTSVITSTTPAYTITLTVQASSGTP